MMRKYRKKRLNRACNKAIFFVLAVMTIVLSVMTVQLKDKQKQYEERIEVLQRELAEEEDYAQQLEEKKLYVQTKQYIEEIAREKLGLVKEDELVVKPNTY